MEPPWHHDLMLSIHSYYVGEYAAGIRSSERILNGNAPEDVRSSTAKNLSFYINPISEDFKVHYSKLETDLVKDNWTLFNPTIIDYGDYFLALVRSSNYYVDDYAVYICNEEDNGVFKTVYYSLILNSNFEVVRASELKVPEYRKTNYTVDGLEDFRIFTYKDSYLLSGTIRNIEPYNSNCRIALCSFDPIKNVIGQPTVIETNVEYEKNWMPVLDNKEIRWVHHPNLDGKTSIIHSDGENFSLSYNDVNFEYAKSFRGGTQLVPFNGKYYSLIHNVTVNNNKRRIYYHRFCEWDTKLNLLRYSKAFYLKNSRTIEFAAGLAIKNDMVHVSFGLDDKEAWIASFTTENMLSLFFIEGKPI